MALEAAYCIARLQLILIVALLITVPHWLVYCLTCDEENPANTIYRNDTLAVNASISDNAITLTCSLVGHMAYISTNTYLKWTEKGRNLPDHYPTNIKMDGTVTVVIHNPSHADYGVYTCQCYRNFTDTDMEDIYHNDIAFHRHCSVPVSVQVIPLSGKVKISNHIVQNHSETVSVNCSTDGEQLYSAADVNSTISHIEMPYEVTVNSSKNQGKYVCINEQDRLMEIHYISIKDYQPPEFLYPPPANATFIYSQSSEVPTCAVYSSLPKDSFTHTTHYVSQSYDSFSTEEIRNIGLYFKIIPKIYLPTVISHTCEFKTEWDSISLNYGLIIPAKGDVKIIPSICLLISLDPPDTNAIQYGGSFTISCSVRSDTSIDGSVIEVHHVIDNKLTDTFDLSKHEKIGDIDLYSMTFENVTEANAGEYVCWFRFEEYGIQKEKSQIIPSITKEIDIPIVSTSETDTNSIAIVSSYLFTSTYSLPSIEEIPTLTHNAVFSSPSVIVAVTADVLSDDGMQPLMYGVIVGCSIVIVMVTVAIVVSLLLVFCYRKRQQKSKVEAINVLSDVSRDQQQHVDTSREEPEFDRVSVWSLTSLTENVHHEKKISENMRKCAHQLIVSNWFIPWDKILFCEGLGSGAFGKVKRAEIFGINNSNSISSVAVKMLKDDANEEAEKGIITEFNVLQSVGSHKHLVSLLGASLHNGKLSLVVEFCSGGDLLKYLRKKGSDKTQKDPLTISQQVGMARQISCGMEYLASKKCVHRDLAARNILITEDGTLKVSDFGLARETYHSMYQMTTKGKIPFKWMAPESIFYQIYTIKSDIWSFGVLLWEILTLGCSPYPGKSVEEVIKDLQKEKLMDRPDKCPVELFNLVLMCWKFEANERTSFNSLKHNLTNLKFEDQIPDINQPSNPPSSSLPEDCISNSSPAPPSSPATPSNTVVHYASQSSNSQGKDEDYYEEDPLGSEGGYVQCKDPLFTNDVLETNLHKRTLTFKLKTSTNTHSTSDQGSVSDIFTDDSSGCCEPSPSQEDSGNYSNDSGGVVINNNNQFSFVTGSSKNGGKITTINIGEQESSWKSTGNNGYITSTV